ncbi:DUF1513 domain-containing protein [Vreelandella venusta]|uniref:DUF1513 domain-containing protein n=1 Tax=Vreelandella venusta TaxID=44935 RepID=A0AAP9ZFV4_9GAMM|nr:DUF1513 domain-containing protein [Halomonas venusta]QRL04144.1 DUF1513 domain-containing protein [Halomonas venusta]WAM52857.1 DUF1513 domain-containing protein [Halomonas venusta]GEK51895.1 hypothetical protein HVE01_26160 [Halomonas venusta]
MQRRQVLKAGLGSVLMALTPLSWAVPGRENADWLFSAVDDLDGKHYIAGVALDGKSRFMIEVPERCHGGCLRPSSHQAVLFARRPGTRMHVIDGANRRLAHTISAGEGYHFYGHGVFDLNGRYLYVTANRLADSAGLVRVYDAANDYAHVRDMSLDGIGPHELRLMPDGDTLVIGLGGIQTHPDYGRVKLNLDTMAPALMLMNRHSGEVVARHAPSHHQLSCRHLDVAADGTVIAGYQFEGPEWESYPLICRLDAAGDFSELALPDEVTTSLRHYTASVAFSRVSATVLVTAPRGNRVLLLDAEQGRLNANLELPDAAGARCDGSGGFLVSSGQGGLYRVTPDTAVPELLASQEFRWDNHLT